MRVIKTEVAKRGVVEILRNDRIPSLHQILSHFTRIRRGARPEEGGVEKGAFAADAGKNAEQDEKVEEEGKRGEGKAAEGLAQTDRDSAPSDQRPRLLLLLLVQQQLDGPGVAKRPRAADGVVHGADDDEPPPSPPPHDAVPASLRYAAPAAPNHGRRHESVSLRYAAAALRNGCPIYGRPSDDGRPDDGATADVGAATTAAATAADDGGATGGGAAGAGEIRGGEEGKGKTRSREDRTGKTRGGKERMADSFE